MRACSTGPARASTTSSPNGSPASAIWRRAEPGRTKARTVYTLTDKGLEALHEYARTPVTLSPLKSEPLMRLLIADLVGEDVTRASLATLRDDLVDVLARIDASAAAADEFPHRSKYLLLVHDFLRGFVALHEDLLDEVERKL